MSSTQTDTRIIPSTNDGDHERFAHYVKKGDQMRSMVEGTPIKALCGKVWVPDRDPQRYPVCPTCKEVLARLKKR